MYGKSTGRRKWPLLRSGSLKRTKMLMVMSTLSLKIPWRRRSGLRGQIGAVKPITMQICAHWPSIHSACQAASARPASPMQLRGHPAGPGPECTAQCTYMAVHAAPVTWRWASVITEVRRRRECGLAVHLDWALFQLRAHLTAGPHAARAARIRRSHEGSCCRGRLGIPAHKSCNSSAQEY